MSSIFQQISFRQPEIYNADFIRFFALPNNEIIRLDIPMDESLAVNKFYSFDHLVSYHQGGFKIKFSSTSHEQIFEGLPVQIHYHYIMILFGTTIVHSWHTVVSCSVTPRQCGQYLGFVKKLWGFCGNRLKFHCHFSIVLNIYGQIHFSECPRPQFFNQSKISYHHAIHLIYVLQQYSMTHQFTHNNCLQVMLARV